MTRDMRTPLRAVVGSPVSAIGPARGDSRHRVLAELRLMAIDLLQLANEAPDCPQPGAGQADVEPGRFRLADSIENIVAILSPRAAAKGVEIDCRIAENVPERVIGDPDRLSQVLLNLVGSAVRFSHNGLVSVAVAVERHWSDCVDLRFEITDAGAAIDADALSALSIEFGQIDEAAACRYGGAGLGIVASNRLVKRMGGWIAVADTPDLGGLFSFTVPLGLDDARPDRG